MKLVFPVIETHVFAARDFVGGDAALDFVNTVNGRDAHAPRDWLDGYLRLLEWAEKVGLLPRGVLRALAELARTKPAEANRALRRAKQLREALFSITTAMIAGKAPPAEALVLLNKHWHAGTAAHALRLEKSDLRMALRAEAIDLDLIASLVAWRFVAYVLAEPRDRLRLCKGNDCAWLFLDRSKAGRRRWCDMAVCGNAAKSRRFYARSRQDQRANRNRSLKH
jgi:predicted RNA-binding Zn ribbon-like protein